MDRTPVALTQKRNDIYGFSGYNAGHGSIV
jgi:hypothetical protein